MLLQFKALTWFAGRFSRDQKQNSVTWRGAECQLNTEVCWESKVIWKQKNNAVKQTEDPQDKTLVIDLFKINRQELTFGVRHKMEGPLQ